MGREDQIEEREVLESIFPDEITDISETEFRISITLDIPEDDTESEPPVMLLTVQYPEAYPDVAPRLDLAAPQNNTSSHPYFNVSEDKEQLLAGVEETINENLGMAMVFTVVSALKEAAEQLVVDRREAKAREQEEAALAAEREENKKFHGEPVNPESFMRWRAGFLKEMEEQRQREEEERLAELKKQKIKEPVKLTGKQLWQQGLVGKVVEDDDDDDAPVAEVEKLKVAA
ncbi:hypothetical protein MCOR25_010086 [Pyricularia grisea]|nr:hypothetical protein MCOR25_010086 [Pyricularia grisea]